MNERPTTAQVLMQIAQGFLQRADLKGGEVDNYAKCFNFLQTIVEGENVVVPAEIFNKGQEAIKELAESKKAEYGVPLLDDADIPVLKPVKKEDISGSDEMVSEGGPVPELEAVE